MTSLIIRFFHSITPYRVFQYLAGSILVTAFTTGGLLYIFQSKLIYPAYVPDGARTIVPTPGEYGMPYEDLTLETVDGVKIKAFLMVQPESENPKERPTVLLLHANAGNVGHRLPIAKVFYTKMRCNVFALSYRGYGLSEGSPSEKGINLDSQAALDHILSHPVLERSPIILYGQSIGGAVAISLASKNSSRISSLIIENTFLSLPLLVPSVMPFLPRPLINLLLHQIWDSRTAMTLISPSVPILFLSGGKDELIPPRHMKELWEVRRRSFESEEEKAGDEWVEFKEGTHNDTCLQPNYFTTISSFISLHTTSSPPPPQPPTTSQSTTISSPSSPSSSPSTDSEKEDMEGSFELIDKEEFGNGSLGPKGIGKEGLKGVEKRVERFEERVKSEL